jgi:HEAT repeat protein
MLRQHKRLTARQRKAALRAMLTTRDREALLVWGREQPQAIRTAFSALFEADPLLRWRAIEALGLLAGQQAESDVEVVREWIRRLFWNMNDESGGLMWHGPEAIGEILVNVPQLISEYVSMLGCRYDEEPFEAGTFLALARVAAQQPQQVALLVPQLRAGLGSADPTIRANAARIVKLTGAPRAEVDGLTEVLSDQTPLTVYDHVDGTLRPTTVADHAAR